MVCGFGFDVVCDGFNLVALILLSIVPLLLLLLADVLLETEDSNEGGDILAIVVGFFSRKLDTCPSPFDSLIGWWVIPHDELFVLEGGKC